MAVHVEELVSEVTVVGGDLPLTPAQLEHIVELVVARIDQRERERCAARAATRLRPSAEPEVGG
jgi:hypothetical protein